MTTRWWRRIFLWTVVGALVVSLAIWFSTRDALPSTIRIASAGADSAYHAFATELGAKIRERTGHRVQVLVTDGSRSNRELVRAGGAEIGLFQHGAIPMQGLESVAPMYPEVVHVVARRGLGLTSIESLSGRRVVIGAPGSGMRVSAEELLWHYSLATDVVAGTIGYERFADDPSLHAAIATTGMGNERLRAMLSTGEYRLLPVEAADALALRYAHFRPFRIPRGFYGERPPVPDVDVPTVATTSFLGVREGASAQLVAAVIDALYAGGELHERFPTLVDRRAALAALPRPVHPEAEAIYDPLDRLGFAVTVMESIVAAKELLVAIGLALFLLWQRWRRQQERERERELQVLKDRLDEFLTRTVSLERAQMETDDPDALGRLRDDVTRLKLEALEELTHESLRGDHSFSIFLTQCTDLSAHIQAKLTARSVATAASGRMAATPDPAPRPGAPPPADA